MKARVSAALCLLALLLPGCGQKITNHPSKNSGPIVAFGDSLTAGVGADEGKTYPDYLAQELGVAVVNRGVSGDATAEALDRLEKDVLVEKPRMVIVWLGANDELRQTPPQSVWANLSSIVEKIQDGGAVVVLVGIPDLPFRPSYNDGVVKLARQKGCVLVENPLRGILTDPELKSDQIHPNSKGYQIVAGRVAKSVKKYAGAS